MNMQYIMNSVMPLLETSDTTNTRLPKRLYKIQNENFPLLQLLMESKSRKAEFHLITNPTRKAECHFIRHPCITILKEIQIGMLYKIPMLEPNKKKHRQFDPSILEASNHCLDQLQNLCGTMPSPYP